MRRRGEEEQATDIKSNNPHLAGGEKNKTCLPMPPATSLGPLRTTAVCRGDADVRKPLQVTLLLLVTSPFSVGNFVD